MLFQNVADYFNRIEEKSSRLEMTDILAELLEKTNEKEIKQLIYLCQGRIAPQYKNLEVGMGEKFVIKAIATVTGYKENDVEKIYKEKGDLGIVAETLSKKKKQKALFSEQLTITKVFDNLMKIAKSSGPGSQETKIKLLAELLNSANSVEAKFIVRIPIGKLRLGSGDPTIMDALSLNYLDEFIKKENKLHKEMLAEYKTEEEARKHMKFKLREKIEEKYNIFSDLGGISCKLKEQGLKGLDAIDIDLGIPIRPTLAERLENAEEIVKKIGKCSIEPKIDGFRMQIHKDKDKVAIFSRNQEEMTPMFPEIVKAVQEKINAKQAIFEGEAVAINEETNEFYSFQVTIQRKRKYDIKDFSKRYPLKLFVFDVMFVDGKNVMDLKFTERNNLLGKLIKEGNSISRIEGIITDDPKRITEYFDECVEKGLEGIIAKDLNSKYIAGARKFSWIKLKRSYQGELSDTIDTLILGYYKGRGQRTQFGLGALLVGVYNKEKDRFESIAKIGTGLSEQQLSELNEMLGSIKVNKKPNNYISELETDVWVMPKYVIEINADEITKSPIHACAKKGDEGLALRFPRMVKLRTDKKPEDATTVEEIKKMYSLQKHVKGE